MSQFDQRPGAYAPPPDDFETFDARELSQDRRGWLFLGATAIVFTLFVAVVTNTYLLGVRDRGESPIITADAEPYRVPPADPGGYEAPDQDLTVHDLRNSASEVDTTETIANIAPVREEPVANNSDSDTSMPALTVETQDADQFSEPEPVANEPAEEQSAPRTEPEPAESLDDAIAAVLLERESEDVSPPVQQPAVTPSASNVNGAFLVQVASFRSEADAMDAWQAFSAALPDLALGRAPVIQEADLGERGTYYRLRIAGFDQRNDAVTYCSALQDRGRDCLVARR
jgi:hypothetical protein